MQDKNRLRHLLRLPKYLYPNYNRDCLRLTGLFESAYLLTQAGKKWGKEKGVSK
jgi:hypothetical protein